jgi:hypothetical protein
MEFTFEGERWRIVFRYSDQIMPESEDLTEVRRVTECWIMQWQPNGGWFEDAYGRTVKHPADRPSKETGRKLALARALYSYRRAFRTVAWSTYHARKGTWGPGGAAA